METSPLRNAVRILDALDSLLQNPVELTLYGRAALYLGFPDPPEEYAWSRDIDAVLWTGQAEELNEKTNFWDAVDKVNRAMAGDDLYISHFFEEDQVILRPQWKQERVKIPGPWKKLVLYRLGDLDLLLSKLMRDDPIDQADARFIVSSAGLTREQIEQAIRSARVPKIPEIFEQFQRASQRLLASIS
jgi:hypothetical protein